MQSRCLIFLSLAECVLIPICWSLFVAALSYFTWLFKLCLFNYHHRWKWITLRKKDGERGVIPFSWPLGMHVHCKKGKKRKEKSHLQYFIEKMWINITFIITPPQARWRSSVSCPTWYKGPNVNSSWFMCSLIYSINIFGFLLHGRCSSGHWRFSHKQGRPSLMELTFWWIDYKQVCDPNRLCRW